MQIALTNAEWTEAYSAGLCRHAHHCARKGRRLGRASLRLEGIGCVAEYAAARLLGGAVDFAVGEDHYGGTDVVVPGLPPIEVKATEWRNGALFVYKDTDPNAIVVLAIVDVFSRIVSFRGWLDAAIAKDPSHWTDRRLVPCYEWKQHELNPMETLPWQSPSFSSPSPSPPPATPGASPSNPDGA